MCFFLRVKCCCLTGRNYRTVVLAICPCVQLKNGRAEIVCEYWWGVEMRELPMHMCHSHAVSAHLGRFCSLRCPGKGRDAPRGLQQAYRDEARDLAKGGGGGYVVNTRATCSAGACVHGHGASSVLMGSDGLT